MSLYRDAAVVLRTYKLGESDRIVVLCTREHGKVRAVAKGVRRTTSKFGSRLEPASHVNLQLYEGRELDIVSQAELVESNQELRADLERIGRAASMLEVIEQVCQEGERTSVHYDLIVGGLRAVANYDTPLVVPSFFLKLLGHEGVALSVDACVECGSDEELVSMDLGAGGVRCATHREGLPLSPQALLILQLILGGRLAQALELPVGAATWEVDHLASVAMERHLERRLRTLRVLDR